MAFGSMISGSPLPVCDKLLVNPQRKKPLMLGFDHAFKTDHATREIAAFYRLRRLIKPEQDSCFMRWANL
jgi:hypothetical protein